MSGGCALVTVGGRGIGRAIVEALVAGGWSVALTYHDYRAGAQAVEEAAGGRARAFQLDLKDHEGPQRVVSQIEAVIGPIDGLVNNAGQRRDALLAMTPDLDWEEALDVNLGGAFRCCRAVLPKMMHRRRGAIVNVSSLAAVSGLSGATAYASSKAALLGLTRSLAREVGKRGVRVNAVLPGFVATDMTSALPEAAVAALRAHECLPGGTSAGNVASVVAFLLSDAAAAITGQALVVDAGTSA